MIHTGTIRRLLFMHSHTQMYVVDMSEIKLCICPLYVLDRERQRQHFAAYSCSQVLNKRLFTSGAD